jgi:predicted nucleic acid-binding protein
MIGVSEPGRFVVYWDASALLSALVVDVHSDEAIAVARKPLTHLVSTLAFAQVIAAVANAETQRLVDAKLAKAARATLRRGPWRRLTLQPDWAVITALAAGTRLRGADLWHLASVSTLTRQLPEARLFSFDDRLSAAAAALGLSL